MMNSRKGMEAKTIFLKPEEIAKLTYFFRKRQPKNLTEAVMDDAIVGDVIMEANKRGDFLNDQD